MEIEQGYSSIRTIICSAYIVSMAPTMEVDSAVCPSSVRIECGSLKPVCARKAAAEDVLDMLETLQDLDNTCETYFSGRTAIPEASAAFKVSPSS